MSRIGDVLEYYGNYVPPRSGYIKIKCPFHDDGSPSATVNHSTGRFRCFVCDISEDAIGVVRLKEGGSYADAKRKCEEIAGEGDSEVRGGFDGGGLFPDRPRNRSGNGPALASWRSQLA